MARLKQLLFNHAQNIILIHVPHNSAASTYQRRKAQARSSIKSDFLKNGKLDAMTGLQLKRCNKSQKAVFLFLVYKIKNVR